MKPSQPSLRVFVSINGDEFTVEREIIDRVLDAFANIQRASTVAECRVFVGVLGTDLDPDTVGAFEHAFQNHKSCYLFVRETDPNQRAEHLVDLIEMLHDSPPPNTHTMIYRHPLMLAHQLILGLDEHNQPFGEDWYLPPMPLRDPNFVGRDGELARVAEMLNASQPLAITGGSGLGKTALAKELAYRMRGQFPAGVFWLESFGPHGRTPQQSLQILARAHPAGRAALAEGRVIYPMEIRAWLASISETGLVIADNIQHVVPLRDLRGALPNTIKLVITSSESLYDIGWNNFELEPMSDSEGLAYLGHVLGLPSGMAPDAVRPLQGIAHVLGGHSLGLRLAAGWMDQAGGWQSGLVYLQRLDDRINVQGLDDGNESFERAFGLLYKTLPRRQRRLLNVAGAFAPNSVFTSRALRAVAELPRADVEALVPAFFSHDEIGGGYRLHEKMRRYALAMLGDEVVAIRERHLNFYEQQARLWTRGMNESPRGASLDMGQLRHAFVFARDVASYRLAQYVLTAGHYMRGMGEIDELKYWLMAVLELAPDDEEEASAAEELITQPSTLRALADLSMLTGYTDAAQAFYDRALLLYYAQKSLSGQANTLKSLGDLRASEGHVAEAQEYYDRTLQLYATIDFQLGRANTLKSLGDLTLQSGDLQMARDYFNRALILYQQIDFQLGQADTLRAIGALYVEERDLNAGRECYRQAIDFYRDIRFQTPLAATLLELGALHSQTNAQDAATAAYTEALSLYEQLENAEGQALALEAIGGVYQYQHRMEAARGVLMQARDIHELTGNYDKLLEVSVSLTNVYYDLGDETSALQMLVKMLVNTRNLQNTEQAAIVRQHMRELARKIGTDFPLIWSDVTDNAPLPDWLRLTPSSELPQKLVYAVRDFMLADNLLAARRMVERYQDILMTDEADEVFARMLRQYAGQSSQTRQIDKYRALLQRCRQIGIDAAFEEALRPVQGEDEIRAMRLQQALDAYDEALDRLHDIPLVYASVQINRATTLREIAEIPGQERALKLQHALDAYEAALQHQQAVPLEYAHTQIERAETLREIAHKTAFDTADYLREAVDALVEALQYQHDLPAAYARTQILRARALYELSQLDGEDVLDHLQKALSAYEEAIECYRDVPLEYARTQGLRARILHEMAGQSSQDFNAIMEDALTAYDEALEFLRDESPLEYARTENNRVGLLRDMAGLPGEDRAARLYQALAACNEALRFLSDDPLDYARTQVNRAHLLREIAGLSGEHRLARMREALATYTESLEYLRNIPGEFYNAQSSRASLLREMAGLSGEDGKRRRREALEAAWSLVYITEDAPGDSDLKSARRLVLTVRKDIVNHEGEDVFEEWWSDITGAPLPDWLDGVD